MLYGIGAKALGEQLGVEEEEAAQFVDTFKAKYTGKDCARSDTYMYSLCICIKLDNAFFSKLLKACLCQCPKMITISIFD